MANDDNKPFEANNDDITSLAVDANTVTDATDAKAAATPASATDAAVGAAQNGSSADNADKAVGDNAAERGGAEAAAEDEVLAVQQRTIEMLRTVFDPEIPVNVYDLGLIYKIDYTPEDKTLHVNMTLTAPGCPAADFIMEDVRQKLMSIEGPEAVDLQLVFDPVWCYDMMSEEAKLELGFL